jgi:hypothetical protein
MNTAVKEKWCAALRSEAYKQGKGRLRDPSNGFCCLGVLTDLYIKEKDESWNFIDNVYSFGDSAIYLPDEVAVWADLDGEDCFNPGKVAVKNDEEWTFTQIADFIEENL